MKKVIIGKKVDISIYLQKKKKLLREASSYYLNNEKYLLILIIQYLISKDDLIKDEDDVNCDKEKEILNH